MCKMYQKCKVLLMWFLSPTTAKGEVHYHLPNPFKLYKSIYVSFRIPASSDVLSSASEVLKGSFMLAAESDEQGPSGLPIKGVEGEILRQLMEYYPLQRAWY